MVREGAENNVQDFWVPSQEVLKIKKKATTWQKLPLQRVPKLTDELCSLLIDPKGDVRLVMGLGASIDAVSTLIQHSIKQWKNTDDYRKFFVIVCSTSWERVSFR